jgi:hypothetical protein
MFFVILLTVVQKELLMPKPPVKDQSLMYQEGRAGYFLIRVSHRQSRCLSARSEKSASYLIRCGCCAQRIEILYGDDSLEINGVDGSVDNWREILLPLMGINPKTMLTKQQEKAQRFLVKARKQYFPPKS